MGEVNIGDVSGPHRLVWGHCRTDLPMWLVESVDVYSWGPFSLPITAFGVRDYLKRELWHHRVRWLHVVLAEEQRQVFEEG